MSSVVGLEMPNAWRTVKPNDNVNFDISANQLNLTADRQMFVPGSTVTWPSTTLHKNFTDPVAPQDAATKAYVDSQVGGKDELSELDDVTITARAANEVLVVNAGNTFWVNAKLVDANLASGVFANIVGLGVQTQILDMGTFKISNVVDPTLAQDAATKNYVDTQEVVQTPWLTDIDAANNSLLNFNTLRQNGIEATAGVIRLINNVLGLAFRNAANTDNFGITGDADDNLSIDTNLDINAFFLQMDEIGDPTTPPANSGRWYVKNVGTVSTPFFIGDDGVAINLSTTGVVEFADDVFRIIDDVTGSKKIAFQASLIAPSTTRTLTVPDKDLLLVGTVDKLNVFTITSSAEFASVISDETGTGLLVFNTSPTFVTPDLGTPSAGIATNLTGVSGITGLAQQVQDLDLAGFGIITSTGALGSILKHNGTIYDDFVKGPDNTVLAVDAADINYEKITNDLFTAGVFAAITGLGVQTQNLDLDTFGIETATGALGSLLKHDGTRYDDFPIGTDNTILAVAGTNLNYEKIVNDLLTPGVFSAITGLGVQSQALDMGTSNKIVNLADPTAAQDAATRAFVLSQVTALSIKEAARVATTANITLSGEQTIDGILTSADRVLVKDQTLGENNGVYLSAAGAWARTTDTDTAAEIEGMAIFIQEGTTQADTGWLLQTDPPIILGTTVLVYVEFTSLGQITAGDGLTKTLNTLDVGPTAGRISVSADAVDIDAAYVGQASITTLGTIGTGVWQGTVIDESFLDTNLARNTDNLSFFAATTSAQLAGVISDETGSGLLVFGTSPTLITPTIASFLNATHDHLAAAGGGVLTRASISDFNHDILSAQHSDSLAATVVRGDLITGNVTPAWARLPIGTALQQLQVNAGGTDLEYFTPAAANTFIMGNGSDPAIGGGSNFVFWNGGSQDSGTEANTRSFLSFAFTITRHTVNVNTNSSNGTTEFTVRDDGADVPNTLISVPTVTTGTFDSGAITEAIAAASLMGLEWNRTGAATVSDIGVSVECSRP